MRKALKRQILIFVSAVLLLEVAAYIITNSAYMMGAMSKSASQMSFYTVALFVLFMQWWVLFGAAYFVVRKCRNCGSKNVFYSIAKKGFLCDDCNYVFEFGIKNLRIGVLCASIPLLSFGPCFLLGNVLAGGILDSGLVFFGILLSAWLPSFFAEVMYAVKLNNSAFAEEHETLRSVLLLIQLLVVPFIMLMVYWWIILEIFKMLGILH
jgi:hypothetical protein